MDLIDNLLSETRGSSNSNVISEQHDLTKINFVAGLSDPGEMIRCGYLPQLRRLANETDEVYAARIYPLVMALPQDERDQIMGAAIKRAGLDTSTGKIALAVAGTPPWNQLGVLLREAAVSAEMIVHASLNWTVSKRPMAYQLKDGSWKVDPHTFDIVRDDTEDRLGTVGARYEPIQNREGFDFLDHVLAQFDAKYETAGAIFGGKKVWMQVNLPKAAFRVGSGDEVKATAIFTNPHDGEGKAYCFPTSDRVVCRNTLRVALRGRDKGIGIRHSGSIKDKISDAQTALGMAVEGFEQFKNNAAVLARVRVKSVNEYVDTVLDQVLDLKAAHVALGSEQLARTRCKADVTPEEFQLCVRTAEREIKSRADMWTDIIDRFDSERCRVHGIEGTLWAAMNAVTEHADYCQDRRRTGTTESQMSRRFESVLVGDRDDLKQVAYQQALALAN